MTDYRVFKQSIIDDEEHGPRSAYEIVGVFQANDAKGAIRQAVEKIGTDAHEGVFAAVPDRGWLQVAVSVETKPVVKLG